MSVTTSITVDVQRPNIPVITYASQGDQLSRTLTITMVSGSSAWTPPSGAVATVRYSKPDGTSGFYDTVEDGTAAVTVSGNVATVKLNQQMTTVAGTVYVQLTWYTAGTNPQRISSFCWRIFVEAAAVGDDTIASTSYYSILTAQIQTCIDAAKKCEAVSAMEVSAETLPAGSEATAEVSGGTSAEDPIVIEFGIPTGAAGPAPEVNTTTISYAAQAASAFDGNPPTSGWQSTVPSSVGEGNYLWTRTVVAFKNGAGSTTTYGVTKYGSSGSGTVDSVNGQTGVVVLDAEDLQYDSTLASHTSGSIGAELATQSAEIDELQDDVTALESGKNDVTLSGASDPTTSTVGSVGQFYHQTTDDTLFVCEAVSGGVYTWTSVGGGGSGSATWGSIGGTLSNQTDLNTALTNHETQIENVVGGDAWVSGTSYAVGDTCIYNNVAYRCITANSSSTFTSSEWEQISLKSIQNQFNGFKLYLYTGTTPATGTAFDTTISITASMSFCIGFYCYNSNSGQYYQLTNTSFSSTPFMQNGNRFRFTLTESAYANQSFTALILYK